MSYSSEVLADAPAIYYRLGEPSGTSAADASGNARNGTYANTPTLGVTGIPSETDTAVTFAAASSQHIAPSYLFNNSLVTVEAWIKIAAAPASNAMIAGCTNGLGNDVADKILSVGSDGKLYFYVFDGAAKVTSAPASTIPLNEWVHCAGTCDGSTALTYMNGVQVGSVAATGSYTGFASNNFYVASNKQPSAPAYIYFNGSIDEVAIYPSALTATRILAHYTAGITVPFAFAPKTFNPIPFMGGR